MRGNNVRANLCSLLGAVAVLVGCDGTTDREDDGNGAVGEQQSSIVDGRGCESWVRRSIVGVGLDSGKTTLRNQSRCSGTLVAPNLVLTARHCVARLITPSSSQEPECNADGSPNSGVHFGTASAQTIYIFDDLDSGPLAKAILPIVPTEKSICNNDIALLVLDRNLTSKKAAPIRALSTKSEPRVTQSGDKSLIVAGFGLIDDGVEDFKGCQQKTVRVLGDGTQHIQHLGSHEFITDYGTCNGDSGGPVFDHSHQLVGVTSRGTATSCRGIGVYPDLAFQLEAIKLALSKAGTS